jgi:hypothetical protein
MTPDQSLQSIVTLLLDGELQSGSYVAGIEPTLSGLHCEILEIFDHPIADLAGFEAPSSWACVGIVAEGSATSTDDQATGDELRCRLALVVDRYGTQSSELRMLGDRTSPVRSNNVFGLVVDAARRCFGIETDPAPLTTATIAAWAWLDAVVAEAIEADGPLCRTEIDVLHPFFGLNAPNNIATLRRHVANESTVLDGVLPIEAKWCDDGAFARWWMYQLLDLNELCDAAASVLDPETAAHLFNNSALGDLLVGSDATRASPVIE